MGAVVVGAAAACSGSEGADAEGLAGDVAVDGVAAARVHALAPVRGRRTAPATLAQLERLVRLRRRRHHLPHRNVLLLLACSFCLIICSQCFVD
jgi:hypothetical protein